LFLGWVKKVYEVGWFALDPRSIASGESVTR